MDHKIIEISEPIDVSATPWTATKINGLLHCVQQYWYMTHSEYIPKELLPSVPSQIVQGSFLHDWAEQHVKDKTLDKKYDMPETIRMEADSYLAHFSVFLKTELPRELANLFTHCNYKVEVESKLALSSGLKPVSFFSKTGKLFSGKIDYLALSEDKTIAAVIDYKATYKTELDPKDYELQLALYGFLLNRHYGIKYLATGIYFIRQNEFKWILSDGNALLPYDDEKSIKLIRSYMERARAASKQKITRNIGPHCAMCQFKSVCHK